MVISPDGNVVRVAHRASGLPVKAVVPLSPSETPTPLTVTVTGEEPGFSTRIGIASISPGVSDTGSAGTETAMDRGALRLGAGDDAANTRSGTTAMPIAIAMTPA